MPNLLYHRHFSLHSHMTAPPRVLAVDDDPVMLMVLERKLQLLGYEVLTAKNGKEACQVVTREGGHLDTILLDREMPAMDGMKFVKWLKKNPDFSNIPIIMQTGSDRPAQIKEGIDAGVFYYLTKPLQDEVFQSVLEAAIRDFHHRQTLMQAIRHYTKSLALINHCQFVFKTLDEAEDIACMLAACFPQPERTVSGLAELLINAVEHGNLGISYEQKTQLLLKGTGMEEIERRMEMPEYAKRTVEVLYKRSSEACKVKIIDQGDGFEWKKFLNLDPSRATDNHGRGVAQANKVSFDKIQYNQKGNEITATVYYKK